MRKKRFILNAFSSLGYQIATIICSLILPNLIIKAYGTEVNGLVSSITQFLKVVSLSEFGITAVIQSSLYKPLSEKNTEEISAIITSSDKFFRRVAFILLIYTFILCILYPIFTNNQFDNQYIILLILILSFNSFAQYFFAVTNSQLLSADQRSYISSFSEIIAIITNTILSVIEINMGFGIHIVKFTASMVFLLKPIITHIYIKKHYNINRRAKYEKEPIKQKWNGISQHFAYYIFTSTDVMVLTAFSTLANVSIYSVYALVLNGIKSVSALFENGIRSLLGEMWAIGDKNNFKDYFNAYEWFMFSLSCFVFGCAASLIVPFVSVYTNKIEDANYIVPSFAIIITIAYLLQNLRGPYHTLIQSVGHYKQTQASYIVSAAINIVISIAMVYNFGLIGVAIGTVIASVIETIWQALYLYRNVLNESPYRLLKMFLIYGACFVFSFLICGFWKLEKTTYISWIKLAIIDGIFWASIISIFSLIFYKDSFQKIKKLLFKH